MRIYLLATALLSLASCAATQMLPQYTEAEKAAQRAEIGLRPEPAPAADTPPSPHSEPDTQRLGFIRRIFQGRPPVVPQDIASTPEAQPDSLRFVNVYKVAGKCKKCPITINVVHGNQTNSPTTTAKNGRTVVGAGASNTELGKKSGDNTRAGRGAIVNKVAGPGNAQTTRGNHNTPQLSAPVQEAADWRAVLARPAGEVAATAAGLLLTAGVIGFLFFIVRKKKAAPNLA